MAKSAAKAGVVGALEFLARPEKHPVKSVCVVFGDELYLKGEVLNALRRQVVSSSEDEFGVTTFTGREAKLRDIRDALSSLSLFGNGRRIVIVEEADDEGPFGARGIGEPPILAMAPAIANAIYNAVGVRMTSLPITAEKVLQALREKSGSAG